MFLQLSQHKFFISNTIKDRKVEINGIQYILNRIGLENTITLPINVKIEGGDVILCNEFLFIGYSIEKEFEMLQVARTNHLAIDFLKKVFPQKKVVAFELNKSDSNPKKNSLHLDCCFQPIGNDSAILYADGFSNKKDVNFLVDYFGYDKIIFVDNNQMYNMCPNIFSISPRVIVSEKRFLKLNEELRKRGFFVEEIEYSEISKMGGLLRCSTLPLKRK